MDQLLAGGQWDFDEQIAAEQDGHYCGTLTASLPPVPITEEAMVWLLRMALIVRAG